jgi:DNA-binding MarR family transcriptional regulator
MATKTDSEDAPDTRIPLDGQLRFSLYGALMAINRAYKPWLDELGITYPQYLVLSVLWEGDGATISAIAERLALEPSSITPLVKRLEQAGLLGRQRNPADEREVHVRLTAKGRGLRAETRRLTDTLGQRSGMTPEQLVTLNEHIKALRDAFVRAEG